MLTTALVGAAVIAILVEELWILLVVVAVIVLALLALSALIGVDWWP